MRRLVIVGGLFSVLLGGIAGIVLAPARLRWCCMQDDSTGFGVCTRAERACLPSRAYVHFEQERAACFHARLVIADDEIEDCNPTMKSCELSRARKAGDSDYDGVGSCDALDANQHRRRVWFAKIAAVVAGTALLFCAVRWLTRRRR